MAKEHEQKENAKTLYINKGLSAKEISGFLVISENTIGKWVKHGGWAELRAANTASVQSIIGRNLRAIDRIYQKAEDEQREPTDAECDRISKLSASMRSLDKGIDVGTRYEVLYDFVKFYKTVNEEAAIACAKIMPDYVTNVNNARK